MLIGWLSGRKSLRDITDNLNSRLYHIGTKMISRAALTEVNRDQPDPLYAPLLSTSASLFSPGPNTGSR